MGIETFAELADLLGNAERPADQRWQIASIEQVSFQRPFKFYRQQPAAFILNATASLTYEEELLMSAALSSSKQLSPVGGGDPIVSEKLHFSGQVRLSRKAPAAPTIEFAPPGPDLPSIPADEIYSLFFHGPAFQVLEQVWLDESNSSVVVGKLARPLPAATSPVDAANLTAYRLVELCLQTAGVWEMKTKGVLALPLGIDRLVVYHSESESQASQDTPAVYALVEPVEAGDAFNARVVDECGTVYLEMTGYRTIELEPVEARRTSEAQA
jgi:hypothetical protein